MTTLVSTYMATSLQRRLYECPPTQRGRHAASPLLYESAPRGKVDRA
jgi:hypothetical protein|eukprot:COSAG01_NODE_1148_length_11519_cov_3.641944_18_plen_47_part_00